MKLASFFLLALIATCSSGCGRKSSGAGELAYEKPNQSRAVQRSLREAGKAKVGDHQKALGSLGKTLVTADIYSSADTASRVYYKMKSDEFLVLRDTADEKFWRVLLQNGKDGYVLRSQVSRLPYMIHANSIANRSKSISASAFIGVPFRAGGTDLRAGIGNGEFVQQLELQKGISLPADPAVQVNFGTRVNRLEDLTSGDRLYFWSHRKNKVGLAGIYLGNGYMIIANPAHGKVESQYVGDKTWLKLLVAARRD